MLYINVMLYLILYKILLLYPTCYPIYYGTDNDGLPYQFSGIQEIVYDYKFILFFFNPKTVVTNYIHN